MIIKTVIIAIIAAAIVFAVFRKIYKDYKKIKIFVEQTAVIVQLVQLAVHIKKIMLSSKKIQKIL